MENLSNNRWRVFTYSAGYAKRQNTDRIARAARSAIVFDCEKVRWYYITFMGMAPYDGSDYRDTPNAQVQRANAQHPEACISIIQHYLVGRLVTPSLLSRGDAVVRQFELDPQLPTHRRWHYAKEVDGAGNETGRIFKIPKCFPDFVLAELS